MLDTGFVKQYLLCIQLFDLVSDTALHACLRCGESMEKCVKALVDAGADVCHVNTLMHHTPIHVAIAKSWHKDIIQYMVMKGYKVDFDRYQTQNCMYNLITIVLVTY